MNDVETAALVGSARGLESLARTVRAKKLPPLGERTWDLLRWAATAQRPAADPRSALTRRLAMAALVDRQPGHRVGDRARAERRRCGSAALCGGRRGDRCAHRRARSRDQDRAGRQGASRPAGGAARLGPALPEDVVRADSRRAEGSPTRTCMLQAIDQLGAGCPAAESPPPISPRSSIRSAPRRARGTRRRTRSCRWRGCSPDAARKALPRFVQHPTWQVRMYAARAAGVLAAIDDAQHAGRPIPTTTFARPRCRR